MNKLILGSQNFEYEDKDIISVSGQIENSMVAETLSADTISAEILSDLAQLCDINSVQLCDNSGEELVSGKDLMTLKFGDQIVFNHDNNIVGKFYLKQIQRTGKEKYDIYGISTVGLLVYSRHNGGVYTGIPNHTVGTIIAEIFTAAFGTVTKGSLTSGYYPYTCVNGLTYRVSAEIDGIAVNGWLPIATCRDSLQQVLFSCGASILKNDAGVLWFGFNQPSQATVIPDSNVYIGGSVDYKSPATKVSITEHQFIAGLSVDDTTLFDNSAEITSANHQLVEFGEPIIVSTLSPQSMINEAGPNYMIVSGNGVITGKPYTHLTRVLTKNTGIISEQNEISAENATLISTLNSANALERLASFYSIANEVSQGIVLEGERAGDLIRFRNPFGDQVTGIIKSMAFEGSGILKANSVIATNWLPNHLGNQYDSYLLLIPDNWNDAHQQICSSSWSTGALAGKKATVVLFGGAHGGYGGYDGNAGEAGKYPSSRIVDHQVVYEAEAYGGSGGNGGNGGQCGNVYQFDIESLASSYNLSFGSGGAGGARNGGTGSAGTDTTMTVNGSAISSALGGQYAGNYINLINGDMYADRGTVGVQGGKGGDETRSDAWDVDHVSTGKTGNSVGSWVGGTGGSVVGYEYVSGSGNTTDVSRWGSGGGGAAYGANGNNGANGTMTSLSSVGNPATGGSGANASPPGQNIFGRGGYGGNGGGGGGAGGYNRRWRNGSTTDYVSGSAGSGGQGSVGSVGSKGFILIYYKA